MTDKASLRVFLVDDQAIVRAAFKTLLSEAGNFEVVGDCGDPHEAAKEIKQLAPDVVLLDLTMPGLSGLDLIRPIKRVAPKVKVLMLTQQEGETFVSRALEAGADGYLSKDSQPEELALALKAVGDGRVYLSPKIAAGAVRPGSGYQSSLSTLTARELEVFQLLALGLSNKEVAGKLHLSVGTVKKHRENLQRKLDCHSTAELARLAIREGLMEP